MDDVEEKQQKSSKTVSTDPNDHTIIKEGDADILMLANKEVFCNKTQVNNRDASISGLRTFISNRKEEHAGLLSQKVKVEHQASEEGSSRAVPEEAISAHDEKPNGECEVQIGPTEDEPIGISKEPLKTLGGKVCRELKPPRVLEALAASGLRALRYACEVEEIGEVIPVDNDKEFQKLKMGGTLVSARASRSSSALARSDDPAWKYGSIDPKNKNHIKCSFCERIIKGGGVTRFKEHLGGVSGEVAACKQVPHDIKWQMERLVMENRKNKTKKRQLNEEIENPHGTSVEEELEEDEDAEVEELLRNRPTSRKGKEKASKTLTQKRSKGLPPMSHSFSPRTTPRSQPSIKYAMATKEQKKAVEMAIGRWWFDANIPFNAAKSKFYQPMCDAITSIGPGFKMPSYHDLRTRILKNTVEEVNGFMDHYKSFWNKTGCSIMADGWTDGKQRTLINLLVYCPKGVIFLKSIDASGIRKNADALFSMFDEVVLSVGPEKVVQFLTDNDATYKAAGQRVAEKYKTFYWTGCAAHCIDLILEEIAKPDVFPINAATIDAARKVTRFIYNHAHVLHMMRKDYTNRRDLIRPAITRFATNFISLQCLFKFRNQLRQMFTSDAWNEMTISSTPIGEEIAGIVLDSSFWKNVEHILSVSESLVMVLRLVDSEDKPAMGYLYEAMNRAKLAIRRRLKKKTKYMPYLRVIDRRWEIQMQSPLHVAACFLNPGFYFGPKFDKEREVTMGINDVVDKVVTDLRIKDVIIRQLMSYRNYNGSFGTDTAIRNRATIAPQDWWAQFGTDAPELQKLAIRILSQCCSSSGCERNWSIFEHIHSPKRNILEFQRLNDLVFVHYNLKLRKRDMMKRTSPNVTDPISLENIDILDEWVCEEPSLLTLDDVHGWTTIEQPTLEGENIPDFDGGGEAGPVIGEELEAEDDDDGVV